MKRFLLLFTLVLTGLSFLAAPAEAKRFGGGASLGKQRSVSPQPAQQQTAAARPGVAGQPGAPAQPPRSRWLGPLAGLAAGLGLAALFSSLGLDEGMGMLLAIMLGGLLLMFLMSALRRSAQPAAEYAGAGAPYPGPQGYAVPAASGAGAAPVPADFPVEAFLRSAKTSFIRLQTANDRKDLDDIREYTTPEMFAEISMQLRDRDGDAQHTDVLGLDASLLEVVTEGSHAIASVRMSGQIRENGGAPEYFDEIWHVQKDLRDPHSVWLLAGIQQVA